MTAATPSAPASGDDGVTLAYQSGFGNEFATEALTGALPQGQPERERRVTAMVDRMDEEGFGSCSNEGECEAVCPKEISIAGIARMNREYTKATLFGKPRRTSAGGAG